MHMTLLTFLRNADFVASIVADGAVLCFAFPAYRRAKMPAFAFLVWGSVIGIILEVGLQFHRASTGTAQDAVAFSEWYRVGYFAAIVLWASGLFSLFNMCGEILNGRRRLTPHRSEQPMSLRFRASRLIRTQTICQHHLQRLWISLKLLLVSLYSSIRGSMRRSRLIGVYSFSFIIEKQCNPYDFGYEHFFKVFPLVERYRCPARCPEYF